VIYGNKILVQSAGLTLRCVVRQSHNVLVVGRYVMELGLERAPRATDEIGQEPEDSVLA